MFILDQDVQQETSRSSSPVFYEKPGLPEFKDDNQEELTLSPNGTRRVKFSNAPIRVNEHTFIGIKEMNTIFVSLFFL